MPRSDQTAGFSSAPHFRDSVATGVSLLRSGPQRQPSPRPLGCAPSRRRLVVISAAPPWAAGSRSAGVRRGRRVVVGPILQLATHGHVIERGTGEPAGNPLLRSLLILAGANAWTAEHASGEGAVGDGILHGVRSDRAGSARYRARKPHGLRNRCRRGDTRWRRRRAASVRPCGRASRHDEHVARADPRDRRADGRFLHSVAGAGRERMPVCRLPGGTAGASRRREAGRGERMHGPPVLLGGLDLCRGSGRPGL